jgi:beta-lactamase regulating signal transducer with metallopeptidase domain
VLLVLGYLAVSILLVLQTIVGFLRTRADIKNFRRIDNAQTISLLAEVRRHLGVEKDVEILLDTSGAGPYAWGIGKQVIAVPREFLTTTHDIQRTVLTHELIHVLRRDTRICLIARVLCCLYWINPLLWFLNSRLKLEMEQSCDDRVVCSGINAADYAGHLLMAIQQFDVIRRPDSAVAMARASSIKFRIRSLLNNERRRGIMSTAKSAGVCTIFVFLGVAISAFAAQPDPAPLPSTGKTNETVLADVRRLVPDLCDSALLGVSFAADAVEFEGHCSTATRVSAFMRNLDRAGGTPKLLTVAKSEDGYNFKMRLENLRAFVPVVAP